VDGKVRKYYLITPGGRRALREARRMAVELVDEIAEPARSQPAAATSARARTARARRV
jgi:DNA-binding PadR family transcriptional regulator